MWPTIFHVNLPFWPHEIDIRSYGLMLMIGFLGGTWWAARRAERVKANAELIVNCGFVALIAAIIGARAFYVMHYWDETFKGRGLWAIINITSGGLEFYGGFLAAFASIFVYLLRHKASLRLYLDIIAPSLAFGLAVTRIGCFLNGCCWGGLCPAEIPWSVSFPYQSPAFDRQWQTRTADLPAELIYVSPDGTLAYPLPITDDPKYKRLLTRQANLFGQTREALTAESSHFRSHPLHPAQLYSSIDAGLLALLLSVVFYRRKRQGLVAAMFLMLYPVMRIFEEIIRVDNPHDTAGLTVSQFVSLPIFVLGLGMLIAIYRMPLRSPLAVPYVPPRQTREERTRQVKRRTDRRAGN